jgi:hypothetical protein
LCAFPASGVLAADKVATVAVAVTIAPRTSVHVSSEVLSFVNADGETSATDSVEFTVGARVARDADVQLSVEPLGPIDGTIAFNDVNAGTPIQALSSGVTAAATWHGSGQRTGRLTFTLHASRPGVYTVPLQFAVTTH